MIKKVSKKLRARAVHDTPVDDMDRKNFKFYVLEGECKKCSAGPHSLIIFDFIHSEKNNRQNIFRTICLGCGHTDMQYTKNVVLDEDPPTETS